MGRFFLQFGEDLFGFATYGFLWVALSYLFHLSIRGVVELGDEVLICTYGSVSAGREKWPFNVLFFLKVEPPCDQT